MREALTTGKRHGSRPQIRKPRTGKVRGWINAQRKIGPYLLVVLADFKLVVALALALGWLNSLAA